MFLFLFIILNAVLLQKIYAYDTALTKELIIASKAGDLGKAKDLFSRGPNPNGINEDGRSPLRMVLGHSDSPEMVKLLLQSGSDPNEMFLNASILQYAVTFIRNTEIVKLLLDYGANINVVGTSSFTILMYATRYNNETEIIKLLIDRGADVNATSSCGWTALLLAARNQHDPEIIRCFLDKRVPVNYRNKDGYTALHLSVLKIANIKIIELLLDRKAEIDARDLKKQTPLHLASFNGHLDAVKYLVKSGANVNSLDIASETPLDLAIAQNKTDVVKFLKEWKNISMNIDSHVSGTDNILLVIVLLALVAMFIVYATVVTFYLFRIKAEMRRKMSSYTVKNTCSTIVSEPENLYENFEALGIGNQASKVNDDSIYMELDT